MISHKWRELRPAERTSCCLYLALRLFCFCFVLIFLSKLWPFVQLFLDMHAPRQPHALTYQLSVSPFVLFLLFFLGDVAFPEYSISLPFPLLYGEYLVRLPSGWCYFYRVTTGWILTPTYVRIQSINQSTNHIRGYLFCEKHQEGSCTRHTHDRGNVGRAFSKNLGHLLLLYQLTS